VVGTSREASDDDRAVLVDWVEQFFVETFSHSRDNQAGQEFIRTAKHKGDQFLLWIVDGLPVSMAMLRAPAARVSRIGPVFTPADRRGHGYGPPPRRPLP
jgi:predicted GNAT family acetyltransferase